MNIDNLVKYALEANQLLITYRSGWDFIGKDRAETVAQHSLYASAVAYWIALEEKQQYPHIDMLRTLLIPLFHDLHEVRTGDLNPVYKTYFPRNKESEARASRDQIRRTEPDTKVKLLRYHFDFESHSTLAGKIAKDADWLQMIFMAKKFLDEGFVLAKQNWIDNTAKKLRTKTAQDIAVKIINTKSTDFEMIWPRLCAHECFLTGVLAFVLTDPKIYDPEEAAFCALIPFIRRAIKVAALNIGLKPPIDPEYSFTEAALVMAADAHNLQFIVRAAKKDKDVTPNQRRLEYLASQIKTELARELAARFMSPDIQSVAWWE
ncbi:MAG: HD domain-containing protein [Candidatus Falkowbacteria bacterium]